MGDDLGYNETYFSHKRIRPDGRCSRCGKHLLDLTEDRRWCDRRQTMLPVCADADLAFIEART